jgi:hypothetical protein
VAWLFLTCAKLIHDGFLKNAAKSPATPQGITALAGFLHNRKAGHQLSATSHLEKFPATLTRRVAA